MTEAEKEQRNANITMLSCAVAGAIAGAIINKQNSFYGAIFGGIGGAMLGMAGYIIIANPKNEVL